MKRTWVPLLLVGLVSAPGCAVWEAHHRAMAIPTDATPPVGDERPWMESYTIKKDGRCELRCTRYGSVVKCSEYRC